MLLKLNIFHYNCCYVYVIALFLAKLSVFTLSLCKYFVYLWVECCQNHRIVLDVGRDGALRGCHTVKFEYSNNLQSSIHTKLVIIYSKSVRLNNKWRLLWFLYRFAPVSGQETPNTSFRQCLKASALLRFGYLECKWMGAVCIFSDECTIWIGFWSIIQLRWLAQVN